MISSLTNPKVKHIGSLKKGKKIKNEFIIEGIHLFQEALSAIRSNRCNLKFILYSKKLAESSEGNDLLSKFNDINVKVEEVSEKVLNHLSEVESPQGVIGVAESKDADFGQLFETDNPLFIILDGVQDPGNLGTIIRSANAFGVGGILIGKNTVNPYNQKVIRSTAGAIFNVNIIQIDDLGETVQALKRRGIRLIATVTDAEKNIEQSDLKGPIAIIIGSEGKGISEESKVVADETVSIPMIGEAESLNAAVSASIILYETVRQRKGI